MLGNPVLKKQKVLDDAVDDLIGRYLDVIREGGRRVGLRNRWPANLEGPMHRTWSKRNRERHLVAKQPLKNYCEMDFFWR